MLGWFRRNRPASDAGAQILSLGEIRTDVHSHLIPGIDDGAATMADALALVRGLMDAGYSRIITTPHINHPHFANTPDIIRSGLADLQAAVAASGLAVEVSVAAEYFVNEHFLRELDQADFLTFGNARYLLIETHQLQPPFGFDQVVQELRAKGFSPVLAHPERYAWAWGKTQQFLHWRELGLLYQLNLGSFSGAYGPQVQKAAEQLAAQNLGHFLGSDTHHLRHVERLRTAVRHPAVQELIQSRNLLNLTL